MSAEKSTFSTGVSAFFEMASSDAVEILPEHLHPIEIRPQRSILNVSAFHFQDSPVGPYAQLMFSVVVPPIVDAWGRHPKGAFFPFIAGTTSASSRRYREELLRVPHLPVEIDARFIEKPDSLRVKIWAAGAPVVDLTVTQHRWETSSHLLHTFMMDGTTPMKADLQITGEYTVHEQEVGSMTLFEHEMTSALTVSEVSTYPFREHWLKDGTEVFSPAEVL